MADTTTMSDMKVLGSGGPEEAAVQTLESLHPAGITVHRDEAGKVTGATVSTLTGVLIEFNDEDLWYVAHRLISCLGRNPTKKELLSKVFDVAEEKKKLRDMDRMKRMADDMDKEMRSLIEMTKAVLERERARKRLK